MVHRESYHLNHDHPTLMERLDQSTWISVMKRITSSPLDCYPMLQMPSCALNLGRYNYLLKPRALDGDQLGHEFTRSTHLIDKPFDPMLLLRPRHVHLKLHVELCLTQKKIKWKEQVYKARRIMHISDFLMRNAYMYYNPK